MSISHPSGFTIQGNINGELRIHETDSCIGVSLSKQKACWEVQGQVVSNTQQTRRIPFPSSYPKMNKNECSHFNLATYINYQLGAYATVARPVCPVGSSPLAPLALDLKKKKKKKKIILLLLRRGTLVLSGHQENFQAIH